MSELKGIGISVFLLITFCSSAHVYATKTEQKTPPLAPEEKYRDLFPLTKSNFTSKLLKSRDAWIVVFHNGSVELQWKTMATHLRGICWVGLIDVTVETELLNTLQANVKYDIARVYPHGIKDITGVGWHNVSNPNDARAAAVASLPDRTIRLHGDTVQDFFQEALMSTPAKFPAYFISDVGDTPAFLKAVAERFEKYFHIGRLVRPASTEIKQLGLGDVFVEPPALFVIVFQGENMQDINAVQYKPDNNGALNYANLMRFLFAINSEFRHHLPGNNQGNRKQEAEMTDIIVLEEDRFEFSMKKKLTEESEGEDSVEKIPQVSPVDRSNSLNRDEL